MPRCMDNALTETAALHPSIDAASCRAGIRYELSFVRRGERALARGEDVCPRWLEGHRSELAKYRSWLAQVSL